MKHVTLSLLLLCMASVAMASTKTVTLAAADAADANGNHLEPTIQPLSGCVIGDFSFTFSTNLTQATQKPQLYMITSSGITVIRLFVNSTTSSNYSQMRITAPEGTVMSKVEIITTTATNNCNVVPDTGTVAKGEDNRSYAWTGSGREATFRFSGSTNQFIKEFVITYETMEFEPGFEETYEMSVGDMKDFFVEWGAGGYPENITFTADSDAVTVENGVMTAQKEGSATVTAEWEEVEGKWLGGTASFTVNVEKAAGEDAPEVSVAHSGKGHIGDCRTNIAVDGLEGVVYPATLNGVEIGEIGSTELRYYREGEDGYAYSAPVLGTETLAPRTLYVLEVSGAPAISFVTPPALKTEEAEDGAYTVSFEAGEADVYYRVESADDPTGSRAAEDYNLYEEPFAVPADGTFSFYAEKDGIQSPTALSRADITTGVAVTVSADADPQWYDLQGRRIAGDHLEPGLYIRVHGDKTVKTLIR